MCWHAVDKSRAAIVARQCTPEEVLMVGDTVDADYFGPRALGMRPIYLARNGDSPVEEWIRTLDELVL